MDKDPILIDRGFLEVTINSHKLMQILDNLTKQVNEHHSEIKILRQVIPTIKQSVTASLEATEGRMRLQAQRSFLKTKQEMKLIKTNLDALDQQFSKFTIQTQKKFKDKDGQIGHLQQERKRIQSLINIYEENRLASHNAIHEKIFSLKQSHEQLEREFKETDTKTDDKLEMMFIKTQSMIKKSNMNPRGTNGSFEMKSSRKTVGGKGFKSPINSTNKSNWAAFSTKLSEIEKKYDQKQENLPQMNKVIYSKRINLEENEGEPAEQNSDEAVQMDFFKHSSDQFNTLFSICNKQNLKNMEVLKNKLIVQEQKLGVYNRKIEKMLQSQSEFRLSIKKVEEKRSQEHSIELIKTEMKKLQLDLAQDLEKKLNKETFEKEKNKILQKIYIVQQNLTEKADKGDMKKAFLFMEEKIKQLIILIASEQNEEKDGAIKKISAKCLSCDKVFEIDNIPANSGLTSRQNESNIRTITRKIRTRVHTSNQNSSINL